MGVRAHEDVPEPKKGLVAAIRRIGTKANLKLGIKSTGGKEQEKKVEQRMEKKTRSDTVGDTTSGPEPKFPSLNYSDTNDGDISPLSLPSPVISVRSSR